MQCEDLRAREVEIHPFLSVWVTDNVGKGKSNCSFITFFGVTSFHAICHNTKGSYFRHSMTSIPIIQYVVELVKLNHNHPNQTHTE